MSRAVGPHERRYLAAGAVRAATGQSGVLHRPRRCPIGPSLETPSQWEVGFVPTQSDTTAIAGSAH